MKLTKYLGKFFQYCINNRFDRDQLEAIPTCEPASRIGGNYGRDGVNMRFVSASGGMVITTNRYDTVKDRHYENLYIVHEGADLSQEISKILMLENLR